MRQVIFYSPTAAPLLLEGAPSPTGGAENQDLMLARNLASRGHAVGIVAVADGRPLARRVDGVEVISQPRIQTRAPVIRTLAFYARTIATLAANPARVYVQRSAGIDTALAALAARLRRRRFVYASAGLLDFDLRSREGRRWIDWLVAMAVRSADEVVVQTSEQAALCRRHFGREPVLIKSIAEPAPPRTMAAEAFLWIGRLASYKQPLAYAELARAVPEARFQMIAVMSDRPEASELAAELADAAAELPNLDLLEPRARDELPPLIERAVAVVNTSESEGMPNVFLEGWAQGVPALTLDCDPDGVIEREALGAFAGGSPARLADLARAMWTARADQEEVRVRCRDYLAREHSPEHIAGRWVEALGLGDHEDGG